MSTYRYGSTPSWESRYQTAFNQFQNNYNSLLNGFGASGGSDGSDGSGGGVLQGQQQGSAEALEGKGQSLFDLFDKFEGQFDYIAENAGVSNAEMDNRLADAGAQYYGAANQAFGERDRDLRRMGLNPNSGKFGNDLTQRALGKAAGYAMAMNNERAKARAEDMQERMLAAQAGMAVNQMGMNAFGQAANIYSNMDAHRLAEKQYDQSYGGQNANQTFALLHNAATNRAATMSSPSNLSAKMQSLGNSLPKPEHESVRQSFANALIAGQGATGGFGMQGKPSGNPFMGGGF